MKRFEALFIAFFLCALSVPSFAGHNAKITDYDTTVSGARETRVTLDYSKWTFLDNSGITSYYSSAGSLTLLHNNYYDSLNNSWAYTLSAQQQETGDTYVGDTHSHNYSADGYYNIYFLPKKNVFNGFGAACSVSDNSDDTGPLTEVVTTNLYYNIGVGHVIDITPMAEAGNLEDRLMEAKALTGRLSKTDLLDLAEIIRKWRMGEYTFKNQDTAKGKFLEDITKVLEASGKLNGPLNGFGFWRISDSRVVNYNRYKGGELYLKINGGQQYTVDHTTGSDISNDINNYGEIHYYYYWPFDWRSQVKFEISYQKALNHNDAYPLETSDMDIYYTYDLTNNFWAEIEGMYSRENYTTSALTDTNSYRGFAIDLNYKAEDFVYITLRYLKQYWDTRNMNDRITIQQGLYW